MAEAQEVRDAGCFPVEIQISKLPAPLPLEEACRSGSPLPCVAVWADSEVELRGQRSGDSHHVQGEIDEYGLGVALAACAARGVAERRREGEDDDARYELSEAYEEAEHEHPSAAAPE